jgi:hypothetical protein
MKKIIIICILILAGILHTETSLAQQNENNSDRQLPPLFGNVKKELYEQGEHSNSESPTGFIKDHLSGQPIGGAEVSVPDKGITTTTKPDGSFKLDLKGYGGDFIVSVKKDGYLPFALNATIDDLSKPFTLFIEKHLGQIVIDSDLHHLGDNNFSNMSANATSFRLPAEGPIFIKEFYIESLPKKNMVLKIGSIIGLDTMASHELGQSNISTFSTPLSIYINSVKIAEIGVNGSNKVIPVPRTVLKPGTKNLIVLQTGINQVLKMQGVIDYDDIEFMNLILEEK